MSHSSRRLPELFSKLFRSRRLSARSRKFPPSVAAWLACGPRRPTTMMVTTSTASPDSAVAAAKMVLYSVLSMQKLLPYAPNHFNSPTMAPTASSSAMGSSTAVSTRNFPSTMTKVALWFSGTLLKFTTGFRLRRKLVPTRSILLGVTFGSVSVKVALPRRRRLPRRTRWPPRRRRPRTSSSRRSAALAPTSHSSISSALKSRLLLRLRPMRVSRLA